MRQTTIRALSNYSRSITNVSERDFFGISDITSKDIAAAFSSKNKLPKDQLSKKYEPLIRARHRLANDESNVDMTFGRVRFDKDNITKAHGQYEPSNTKKLYDTVDIKQMFVADDSKENQVNVNNYINEGNTSIGNVPYKISEVSPAIDISDVLRMFKSSDAMEMVSKYSNKPPLTFYFEDSYNKVQESPTPINKVGCDLSEDTSHEPTTKSTSGLEDSEFKPNHEQTSQEFRPRLLLELEANLGIEQVPIDELDPLSEEYNRRIEESLGDYDFDTTLDKKYDVKGESRPVRALDYLKKVRSQRVEPTAKGLKHRLQTSERPYPLKTQIKLDSQGFRNYTNQVPDWSSIRRVDLLTHIKKCILYNNYDILALNKPYGIASHDEARSREAIDMNSLVQEVANSMNIETVYLVHRLDKTTTGVLLFATSKERANHLNKLFKSDAIKKTYWCITKGVPDPESAVIDMPIGELKVAGKLRSCPVSECLDESKQLARKYREARRAITEYHVLRATTQTALVEVKPRTGVKHQIRCHLGFGLKRPILGDHKYSHIGKLAPQKLSTQLLNALHLRQAKVRTLPIHLHAKTIVIPGAKANGETLFISAPLPKHFIDNMKSLKLYDDEIRQMSS